MSKVTAQGKGAREVTRSCWISHRGGSPHRSLPGPGCGLPCCNSAREMLSGSSRRGRPVCWGHPAWERPLYPALNLKMMLQILESRDSPQYPHYPLQPREGGLPSTGVAQHLGEMFFPPKCGIFFFSVLFSESQLGEFRFPQQLWGKMRQENRTVALPLPDPGHRVWYPWGLQVLPAS